MLPGHDSSPRGRHQKLFSLKLKREDKNQCFCIEFPTTKNIIFNAIQFISIDTISPDLGIHIQNNI